MRPRRTPPRSRWLLSFALAATLAPFLASGCSSDATGASKARERGTKTVELSPQSSIQTDKVGQLPAMPDTYFIVVDLQIRNHSDESLPLLPPLFSVLTNGGVEYMGDAVTEADPRGCPSNGVLAPDGEIDCVLVFRAPVGAATSEIHYNVPEGPTYAAPLATIPCGLCDDGCHDFSSDPANCGGCGQPAGQGQCAGGMPACAAGATFCSGECVDLSNDPRHCGTCDHHVPAGMTCVNGVAQCGVGAVDCDGRCVPPDRFGPCCNALCASIGSTCTPGSTAEYQDIFQTPRCIFEIPIACDEIPNDRATDPNSGCTVTGATPGLTCSCE